MKVIFYKGMEYGTVFDSLVCWWISGKYSHVELVIGDFRYSSNPKEGVVKKPYDIDESEWDIIELDTSFPFSEVVAAEALLGCKYDYLGLFGFVFRPAMGKNSRWFCSEFVAHCLGFSDAWRYDPAILYSSLTYCKK